MLYSKSHNDDCMNIMANCPDKFYDWGIADIPFGIDVGNMGYVKDSRCKVKQKDGSILKFKREKL